MKDESLVIKDEWQGKNCGGFGSVYDFPFIIYQVLLKDQKLHATTQVFRRMTNEKWKMTNDKSKENRPANWIFAGCSYDNFYDAAKAGSSY